MKTAYGRLAAAVWFAGAAVGTLAAAAPLRYDYKPSFSKEMKSVDISYGEAGKAGAVRLEEKDFVNKPNSLRLDCSATKNRVIVVNFLLPKDRLEAFRGKRVVFKAQVKYLKGMGELAVHMRGHAKDSTLASQTAVFKGEKGKWLPLELHCMIPPPGEVERVDFHLWLTNTPDPAAALLDEVSLEEEAPAAATGKIEPTFMAFAGQGDDKPLLLADKGKPLATIVTAKNPTRVVQYAVKELSDHVALCTGAKLPVTTDDQPVDGPAIHVGATALTKRLGASPEFYAADHWLVWRVGDTLILSGGDSKEDANPATRELAPFGTVYAVYEFLERALGVRWYWPGDLGRVAPKRETLSLGRVRWQGAPSYDTRFCFYAIHDDPDFTIAQIDTWWRRMRWGSFGGSPIGMHSFGSWSQRFAKDHPDWFALQRNGQRMTEPTAGCHVCLSNPEVFKQVVADVRAYFDKYPAMKCAAVMPGDSFGLFCCQCKDCQAQAQPEKGERGMYSRMVWSFVNRVAAEIQKSHPDHLITCCSYSEYADVPQDVTFQPNVAVTICHNNFPAFWKPTSKSDYLKRINEWSLKCSNVYIWDYWYSRRSKGTYGSPSIAPHAMKEWLMLDWGRARGHVVELAEINAEGKSVPSLTKRSWADWMFDQTNMYVAMRLFWNLDQDVDQILNEFYMDFYGPTAGPLVKKFYDRMEQAWADPVTKGAPDCRWDWSACWVDTYSQPFVKEVMGYLRDAEKQTRGQEPYHARAAKTLIGFLPFEGVSGQFAAAANREVRNTQVAAPKVDKAPALDGTLSDPLWQKAAIAGEFVDSFNGPDVRAKTEVRLLRDAGMLYVGIRADLHDGRYKQKLPPDSVDRWVWDEESVELFFVQGVKKYQFLIGPDNIYADNFHPDLNKPFDMAMFQWNCAGVQHKTVTGDKGWIATLAIPLASLELSPPTKDKPWRVNFCRNHYYADVGAEKTWQWELSTWRPTFGSFHNVDRYGVMYFE